MLSVCIVNWNTREHLRACLESIRANPPQEDHEVIVVDNASSDRSADMVREQFPSVILLAQSANVGYARGNNLAFGIARGDLLLTLNPDTEVRPRTLQLSSDLMRKEPGAGCVAARLVHPDGRTQRSVRGFPTFWAIVGDVTGLGKLFPASKLGSYRLPAFDYSKEQEAAQPMGTFLLFRREALADVGDPRKPFDESFPIFFNEVDLLYRLSKAGWKCIYSPDAQVVHHGAESTRQVRKSMIWESHKSLLRFMRKHRRAPLSGAGVALLAPLVYAAAFIRAKGYHAGFRA